MGYGLGGNATKRKGPTKNRQNNKSPVNSPRKNIRQISNNPTPANKQNKFEALQKQTQLYAELARELEGKLAKRNAEIAALRRANQVLQRESAEHKARISNLETQCVSRSEKVAQLSDTIATRKSNKVQERLIEKSLEIADLVEENGRLKIQRKHLQDDKTQKAKLLLEMSEIIRMLNQIDVDYDMAGNDVESTSNSTFASSSRYSDYSVTPSADLPQDAPMENVRRKVKAMEDIIRDAKELKKENAIRKEKLEALRGNNADLNFQIASLESNLREHEEQARENAAQKERLESLKENNANLNLQIASLEAKLKEQQSQPRRLSGAPRTPGAPGTPTSLGSPGTPHTPENPDSPDSLWVTDESTPDSEYTYRTYSDESSKEVSYEEFVVENGRSDSDSPSEDTSINDTYRERENDALFTELDRSLSTVDECLDADSDESDESDESDASDSSSFSSLESPPSQAEDDDEIPGDSSLKDQSSEMVRPEEHKQLQKNFVKALDVIQKLKKDLSRRDKQSPDSPGNSEKESKDYARLEEELEQTVTHYRALKEESKALHERHKDELETNKRIRANLEATYKERLASLEETSKENIAELTSRNKYLEHQYNDLETEYSLKIESLQQKLKDMKQNNKQREDSNHREDESPTRVEALEKELREQRQEMSELREEYNAMEMVQQERVETFLKDNITQLEDEKKKYKDLRYEYDTFLEIHLKIEEEAEEAKQHYKDSLLKIRNFESEAAESKNATEKIKNDHNKAIKTIKGEHEEVIKKFDAQHQKEVKKLEATILEWKRKFTKLKRDHVSATKAHNEATQKFVLEIKQIKKDHGVVMAKQGRMRQSDASKYQKLRRDYDASLVEHGKKEQIIIYKFEQSKKEYESKLKACDEKIKEFEKKLASSKEQNEKVSKTEFDYNQSNPGKADMEEMSKRFETETNQQFLKEQAESKEKLNQLVEANQKLEEQAMRQEQELERHRKEQEVANTSFHDLAASYQAALLKIESLIQHTQSDSIEKITEEINAENKKESPKVTETSLMDHNNHLEKTIKETPQTQPVLEKKTEGFFSKTKPALKTAPIQSKSDSGFQRDFNMIVTKLGVESSSREPNLEVSSDVSSIGSSMAGSAIFEAIRKRLEEHSQKMEIKEEREPVVHRVTAENVFDVTIIYDLLQHFVFMREVNSSVMKLPRFWTPIDENKKFEESIATEKDSRNIHEIVSDVLVHKKRFESVQSSLMRQISMTQLDALYPSTLIGLFPSEYGVSRNSISVSDLGFSSTDIVPHNEYREKPIPADENSIESNSTNSSVREALIEAARLQGENFRKFLYVNTEELKSKTREKETRLLNIKYQKLREEFQKMQSGQMPETPLNSVVQLQIENGGNVSYETSTAAAMEREKRINCFRKKVLCAELKVELSRREWEQQKSFSESEGEGHTWGSMATSHKQNKGLTIFKKTGFNKYSDGEKYSYGATHSSPECTSNDSEDCSTVEEAQGVSLLSLVVQDGKTPSFESLTKETVEETEYPTEDEDEYEAVEDGDDGDSDYGYVNDDGGRFINGNEDGHQNNDSDNTVDSSDNYDDTIHSIEIEPNTSIDTIQKELRKAKEAAEAARKKQLERENNLRDVIYQYKKLQKQHEEALAEKQQPITNEQSAIDPTPTANLVAELKKAKENIREMKEDIELACEQQNSEKEHMRDVMGQFQTLQVDFLKVLAEKQELEKAVYQRPGLASGIVPVANTATSPPTGVALSSQSYSPVPARPVKQPPTPGGSNIRRVASSPRRGTTNVSSVNVAKTMELCDHNRVPASRSIRPQGPTGPVATSKRMQTQTQMNGSKLKQPQQKQNHQQQLKQQQVKRNQQQQQKHPSQLRQPKQQLPPQTQIQKQQPPPIHPRNKQMQQQHTSKPTVEMKNPSHQQQQQAKQQPQAAAKTKPMSKKKTGFFRGWKKQQSGKNRQAATDQRQIQQV